MLTYYFENSGDIDTKILRNIMKNLLGLHIICCHLISSYNKDNKTQYYYVALY